MRTWDDQELDQECTEQQGWYFKTPENTLLNDEDKSAKKKINLKREQVYWQTMNAHLECFNPKYATSFQQKLLKLIEKQGAEIGGHQLLASHIRGTRGTRGTKRRFGGKSTATKKSQEQSADQAAVLKPGIRENDRVWIRFSRIPTRHRGERIHLWGFAAIQHRGVYLYLDVLASQNASRSGLLLLDEIKKYACKERFQYLVCKSLPLAVPYYCRNGWRFNQPHGPAVDFKAKPRDGVFMHYKLPTPAFPLSLSKK